MLALFTILLLVLLFSGLPVAFSLGLGGIAGMVLFLGGEGALAQVPIIGYKSLDDFVLVSVPLYILMSQILLTGKVGNDLFELANKWLCHLPGGLGVATVIACARPWPVQSPSAPSPFRKCSPAAMTVGWFSAPSPRAARWASSFRRRSR